jgi:epoxide hydrolase 4
LIELITHQLPHQIELSCRVSGPAGRPVLLFLHGFPEAAFIWDELLAYFSRPENGGYRCVAPNLRGYEHSSSPSDVEAYRAKHLVQDIAALKQIESPNAPLAGLIAHDWGGAVAWNYANQAPDDMTQFIAINSPHPGTFLRELQNNPAQQQASAYMNFLIREDAQALLEANDYQRLWEFFTLMGATSGPFAWLDEPTREKYRAVWGLGLNGGLHYYRASPLRPATAQNQTVSSLQLPASMLQINVPTCVIWGMADRALPPALLEGLETYVPQLTLHRIPEGTHWIIHEQPLRVAQLIQAFLRSGS